MKRRQRAVSAALVLAAALSSGACSAGLDAHTVEIVDTVNGRRAEVGDMWLRNVHVVPPSGPTFPAGGSAPLEFAVFNQGDQPDTLVSVTVDPADAAGVQWAPTSIPAGAQLRVAPVPTAPAGIATATATITGLTRDLRPGNVVGLTFTFQRAGATTLEVLVNSGEGFLAPSPTATPSVETSGGSGGSESEAGEGHSG